MAGEQIDDDGPAFPRTFSTSAEGFHEGFDGMSFRAYLAGQALSGLTCCLCCGEPFNAEERARRAVDLADAVIAQLRLERRNGK